MINSRIRKFGFLLSLVFVLGSTNFLAAASADSRDSYNGAVYSDIPNFKSATDEITRGGRPTYSGVRKLSEMGVRTVINLENDSDAIRKDQAYAEKFGIDYYSFPMSWMKEPKDATIDEILQLLQDESAYPIFIHCKHGQDRTGLLIGLYRVFVQNWTADAAYQEMLDLGFHPRLWALDRYFKKATRGKMTFADFYYRSAF